MTAFQNSWDNAFSEYNGDPTGFAGGTMQMVNGFANYTDSTGKSWQYGKNADPSTIAKNNPEIGQAWEQQFGSNYLNSSPGGTTPTTTPTSTLDMYANAPSKNGMSDEQFYTGVNTLLKEEGNLGGTNILKEWMGKYGYSAGDIAKWYNAGSGGAYNFTPDEVTANLANPTGGSSHLDLFQPGLFPSSSSQNLNGSQSTSGSRTGLGSKYLDQIMAAITPSLVKSVTDLPGQIDSFAENALEMGQGSAREALKYAGENVLESFANRGLTNSSIAGDAMGDAVGDVATNTQNLGYQAGMDKAQMKLTVPQILGQLAQLGNVSESSSQSSSLGASSSESSSPNVPYDSTMNFILGMMG